MVLDTVRDGPLDLVGGGGGVFASIDDVILFGGIHFARFFFDA